MKFLMCLIFLFMSIFSISSAEDLPKYKMIDLGLFETDISYAISVNENGQVLGTFEEGGYQFLFLWDENTGLSIIDLPAEYNIIGWPFLNNKGQIAFIAHKAFIFTAFFWDRNVGFWEIESSGSFFNIVAFNDNGQVAAIIDQNNPNNHVLLWDHGKKTNLTNLFREQIKGDWYSIIISSLNNHGHIIFNAHKLNSLDNGQECGSRSFLWKDNIFEMILPEMNWDTSTVGNYLDDDGNMLITTYPRWGGAHKQYFLNGSKNHLIPCQGEFIRNGLPIRKEYLQGKLKTTKQGQLYFSAGIQIKKLLKDEYPYFNVANSTEVWDQNSKGYVVGSIDTYFGKHAFLAIPEI